MKLAPALAIFAALTTGGLSGQTPPAFDVASIRLNDSGSGNSSTHYGKGQIRMENTSLKQCIQMSYDVRDFSFSGPDWLDNVRFDILAKSPEGTQPSQMMAMLRTLLAERFGLETHRESRVVPAYALVVAKKGPKLEAAEPGPASNSWGRSQLTAKNVSMEGLADLLARQLDRPVKDMTGLTGVYDVKLVWTPDDAHPLDPRSADRDGFDNTPAAPSLMAALQETLGLRLEARKLPIDVLVVDRMMRTPTEN